MTWGADEGACQTSSCSSRSWPPTLQQNQSTAESWLNGRHLVSMDNAALHASPETAQLIAHTDAPLLSLPPYSPDLNPIEHDFAALKTHREYHEHASIDRIVKAYQ